MAISISIIIPFYNGNKYLKRLISSIENIVKNTEKIATYELIVVNDSPEIEVILPDTFLNIEILKNERNIGIQGARINGLKHAKGEWIIFLDQDDELILDGFEKQLNLVQNADIIVGNGIYKLGDVNIKIYENIKTMNYLIQRDMFIKIRNLIPSPGECLIKRNLIPDIWMNNKLQISGADDWFLWLLLLQKNAKFQCNEQLVYIHNDTEGNNLSADLKKMKDSSMEMLNILKLTGVYDNNEIRKLKKSIEFKYYQDTKQMSIIRCIKYGKTIVDNIIYKIKVLYLKYKV